MILARHGRTQLNNPENPLLRAWEDMPLSPEGQLDAKLLAYKLRFFRPKSVSSSDLMRDAETAHIIAHELNITKRHPKFNYRTWDMGTYAGKPEKDVAASVADLYKRPWEKPPGSDESFNDFAKRFVEELEGELEWAAKVERPTIVVTHGKNIAMADSHITGREPLDGRMPMPGGYAVIRVLDDRALALDYYGDTENVVKDV